MIVILSAVMVNHWSVLNATAILIKMLVVGGYAILAAILLKRPDLNKHPGYDTY
jgi:hypothetical protein